MNYLQSFVLGAVQGVTEFLPISSSGHLILGEDLLGLDVSSLKSFDVVVHLGSLLAIVIYFWKDIVGLVKSFFRLVSGKLSSKVQEDRIFLYVCAGTVPAVLVGLFLEEAIDGVFRKIGAVLIVMMLVAVFFFIAEKRRRKDGKSLGGVSLKDALMMGVAQAVAIIPGVSRSGSTIATGLLRGIDRSSAARFSFLLGVPAIAGAGLLTAFDVGAESLDFGVLAAGFVSSFVFGLLSVSVLMRFLKNHGLTVFGVYLLVLGGVGLFLLQ